MQQRRRISEVRHKPTLAVILSVALLGSGLVAAGTQINQTQSDGTGPVAVMNQSSSFDSGTNVVVDDAAITAQGEESGSRTVKEFQRVEPFSMFALTWQGVKSVTAFVRAEQPDGSWSQWYDMESQSNDNTDPAATNGTELVFHGSTSKIQVSTHNIELFDDATEATATDSNGAEIPAADEPTPDTDIAPLPSNYGDIQPVADVASDLEAVFIDGNADAGFSGVGLVADTDGMPTVVSRAGWGADESLRCRQPTIDDRVAGITIHHTAGSNTYTQAESAARMRGYYSYHAKTLGWCDIGYHALVDKYGTIYEGRAGGLTNAVQGAHAGGFNENTWAISMMGDYSTLTPSNATIQSVGELAGWRAKVAGIEPKGSGTHYSEGSSYTQYSYGTPVTLPNIFAHRDVGLTACPGDAGYGQMGKIRDIAQAKYTSIQTGNTTVTQPETTDVPTPGSTSAQPTPQQPVGNPDAEAIALLTQLLNSGSSANTSILDGVNVEQILTGIGSIAAIAIAFGLSDGNLSSSIGNLNGVPVLEDISLNDVIPVVNTIANLSGDNKYTQAWNDLNNILGPVLGNPTGGETTVGYASGQNSEVSYIPFENGIMVSSPETGTHGLWGVIGDTWTQQGADLGPLGLPLNHEYQENGLIRVDFQGGYITFDPVTGTPNIVLN